MLYYEIGSPTHELSAADLEKGLYTSVGSF